MVTRCVWTCSVEWDRAMEILRLGCGRRVTEWTDCIWRYWQELGWDQRPSSELDVPPHKVQVYSLNPLEILLLGVLPQDPVRGVLFLLPDVHWAAVVTETPIERLEAEDT